uniref:Uncharacterized protein n=1 Tax=Oryza punctata TaxID=4537 RepID=A0A0E0MIC4_ORYPU
MGHGHAEDKGSSVVVVNGVPLPPADKSRRCRRRNRRPNYTWGRTAEFLYGHLVVDLGTRQAGEVGPVAAVAQDKMTDRLWSCRERQEID